MKQRTRFMGAILCIALLLTACGKNDTPAISPEEEALQRYKQACENVSQAPDITLEVDYTLSRTVGGEVYTEKMTEMESFRGLHTKDAVASVKQQVTFGSYETQYAEFYRNGTAYCKTDDAAFCAEMDMEQFRSRLVPTVLLSASIYGAVKVDRFLTTLLFRFLRLQSWKNGQRIIPLRSCSALPARRCWTRTEICPNPHILLNLLAKRRNMSCRYR